MDRSDEIGVSDGRSGSPKPRIVWLTSIESFIANYYFPEFSSSFKMRLAPLSLPLNRRLQTLSVLLTASFFFICTAMLLVCLMNPWTYPLLFPYFLWIALDAAPDRGGRRSMWLRQWTFWCFMRDFFPCQLVLDTDPSEFHADRNYIMGYHPHGIIATGLWLNFCTEANSISKRLPQLQIHPLTLSSNLRVPFWREMLLSAGLCSVDRSSMEYMLRPGTSGQALILVPGGAREALDAHPGQYRLTLKSRLGFIKMAIRTGADLVPVFAFGETDLFCQVPNAHGSFLRQWQHYFLKNVGFAPCLPYGRGVFNYDYGLLPRRRRLVTVIGRPIRMDHQEACPSLETVLKYQRLYMEELQRIFDKYKDEFIPDRQGELELQ